MARLSAETKQIIRNFYKEKEKELRKSYDIYKQEFINTCRSGFNLSYYFSFEEINPKKATTQLINT